MGRLKNILLPAGGFGTRLNGYLNLHNCKSLITDTQGITLLEHTLHNLSKADVADRVIILTRPDVREITQKIAEKSGMPYLLVNHSGLIGMRRIPVVFRDLLADDSFLLMCGHAPALPQHIQALVNTVKNSKDIAVSLYRKSVDDYSDSRIMAITNESGYVTSLGEMGSYFIESPFILNNEVIDELQKSGSSNWIGESIRTLFMQGRSIRSVLSTCPVESDYPKQIDSTISWVKSYCSIS